jgi:DNA polymerase III subunit delta
MGAGTGVAADPPWQDGGVSTAVLVLGDEEFLAGRAVADEVAAARAAAPEVEVHEHEGSVLSPGEVRELLGPSLFGGPRVLVVLRGQDARKEAVAALLSHATAADDGATLVVTHAGGAKGRALSDGLRSAGARVVTAARITRHRERVEFVRAEVRRLGGRCAEDAAEALLAAVGNDLRELAAACSQLVTDTDGRIDAGTVARYYRGRAEVSGFTVADAAMVGDAVGALEALRWALHIGVNPVPIADALADGVRTVARVAAAGRGRPLQLATALGMPPWKIERAQRQARGWTPEGLVAAMRAAAQVNSDVKGGSDSSAYALERAIVAVVSARAAGG